MLRLIFILLFAILMNSNTNCLSAEQVVLPPERSPSSDSTGSMTATLTNTPLGLWVGVWRIAEISLLLTNSPFPSAQIPDSLELRVYPYRIDYNEMLTYKGSRLAAEFVAKREGGRFGLWDEGWPVTLYPWEIVVGPIGSPRRFNYVLSRQGNVLTLEMISSPSNIRLRMRKISDDPGRPIHPELVIGKLVTDEMLAEWERSYQTWLRKVVGMRQ